MSQDLVDTLTITVVGFGLVVVVLIVLSYCFGAMKLLAGDKKDKKDNKKTAGIFSLSTTGSDGDGIAGFPEGEGAPDKDELAVVIAVAVAAFMSTESVVTSIRRVEDTAAWSRTGRHDQMVAS